MIEKRFEFGRNWEEFISVIDEERILEAEKSLIHMLSLNHLDGKRFLDVGSGSGLFSLAAMRLGAEQVYSFDYDLNSVACTKALKQRYYADSNAWVIQHGDVLDIDYLSKLGKFDIVYAWGVLHHTGALWQALKNVTILVSDDDGYLYIAIYNYQPYWTSIHTAMKRLYVSLPKFGQWLFAGCFIGFRIIKGFLKDVFFLKNPLRRYRDKKKNRGMSMLHDWIDWLGGFPFETAKPEEVFDFYHNNGYYLKKLKTCGGGHGCNEFVFRKLSDNESIKV